MPHFTPIEYSGCEVRINDGHDCLPATNDDGPTWQTASGLPGTIKRIHLVGNNAFNNNTSEMTYEYVYFDNVIPTDDASYEVIHINTTSLVSSACEDREGITPAHNFFQPPAGAYCEGRKSDKKLPSVPSFFSAYIEVFDPQQNLITFTDVSINTLWRKSRSVRVQPGNIE